MSALFGRSKGPKKPAATGLTIQTSSNAVPVPIIWGAAKIAPNIIWYDDFKARKEKAQGGKGGNTPKIYKYSASVVLAICEGPIADVNDIWRSLYLKTDKSSVSAKSSYAAAEFDGSYSQSAWSYLTTNFPDAALTYRGIAYIAIANYDLGEQPQLPQHNFEVQGVLFGTAIGNTIDDADPALLIDDFLTNEYYGTPFNPAAIDNNSLFSGPDATTTGDSTYQTYCQAMGWGLSPALSDAEEAAKILERWLRLTNTAPVWSGSTLKFIPYGDEDITANGVTYLTPTAVQYSLTKDDFLVEGDEDPVTFDREDTTDAKNSFFVEIMDRSNDYNLKPMKAQDQASIEKNGLRQAETVTAHEIKRMSHGDAIAHLIMKRANYIRNKYHFKLSQKYMRLEAMDIVSLTDELLGMDEYPVRILEIVENDEGELEIEAEDFPTGIGSTSTYSTQSAQGTIINSGVDAGDVNTPIIFEAPATLTNGNPEIWVLASSSDQYFGGVDIWLSTDDAEYFQIGFADNTARTGELSATLPTYASSNPDTVNTLAVDLTESNGELDSATATDAENELTLCYVDGEFLSYEDASLTSTYEYDLTNLYRGLHGSTAASHAVGSVFARLDDSVFKYSLPEEYVGQTLYIKFLSYNAWGNGNQQLSDVTAVTFTPTGIAWTLEAPTGVTITPAATTLPDGSTSLSLSISWTPSTSGLIDRYEVEVEVSGSGTWVTAPNAAGDGTTSVFTSGVQASTDYVARVRAVRTSGESSLSSWASSAPTSSGAVSGSAPSAATALTATGSVGGNFLEWSASPSAALTGYKLYAINAATGSFGSATLIGTVGRGSLSFFHGGLPSSDVWRYWVVAYNAAGDATEEGPQNATTSAGSSGGVDVEDDGVATVSTATTLNFTGAGVVVTDAGGGQADIAITGGGGGGVSPFWDTEPTPPSSSGLTLVKGGSTTATLTDTTRGFVLDVVRSSGGDRGAQASQANPNGAGNPFVMTALFVPNVMSRQYDSFGFFVSDSGSGRIEQFCLVNDGLGPQRWSAIDTYSGNGVINGQYRGWGPIWLKLELTSTDLIFSVSFDGETWSQVYTQTKSTYVGSITDCGIELMTNPNSSSQYQGQHASVHVMSYLCV